jgi:ankyrin repeat protein
MDTSRSRIACLIIVTLASIAASRLPVRAAEIGTAANTPTESPEAAVARLTAALPSSQKADYIRWVVIQRCLRLPRPPAIASTAQSEYARGSYLFDHASPDARAAGYEQAASAFAEASLHAPCVYQYYFDRALALQQAVKYGGSAQDAAAAAMSWHWYLATDPHSRKAKRVLLDIGSLEAQADIASDTALGWVPLVWAAADEEVAEVRALVANGADVNATYDFNIERGVTALVAAAESFTEPAQVSILKMLVAAGAKIDAADNHGYTPLFFAAMNDELSAARYLLAHGADVDHVGADYNGASVLGEACYLGHMDMVKYLVSAGADINLRGGNQKMDPLFLALEGGHLDVAQYLLSAGADINLAAINGITPLNWAASMNKPEIVQLLLSHGADVDAADKSHNTPLTWAAKDDNLTLVQSLLSRGAVVDVADKHDLSALYWASAGDYLDIARLLVAHGADVDWVSNQKSYLSVLGIAAHNGYLDMVQYLIGAGAKVNIEQNDGTTPLLDAASNDKLAVVEYLLSQHASVDATTHNVTPLFWAAGMGYMDVARALVAGGADVNWHGDSAIGLSVLEIAAKTGQLPMVQYLIARGAEVNYHDSGAPTAYDYAVAGGKLDIANYLRSHGGKSGLH